MRNIKFLNISKNYRNEVLNSNVLNKKCNVKFISYEDALDIAMKALSEI